MKIKSKKIVSAKKPTIKVRDLRPQKDPKGACLIACGDSKTSSQVKVISGAQGR
jgi:hypothetical protein